MIDDVKEKEQDTSEAHEGDYFLLEESKTSKNSEVEDVEEPKDKDNDEEDGGTSVKDLDGDGDGDKDNNSGGSPKGPAEWLRFLIPRSKTKALGAMAKYKASSLRSFRKKPKTSKINTKIVRKGKAAQ